MLVLIRKRGETTIIGNDEIAVTVLEVQGDRAKLGFTAPAEAPIHREEVYRVVNNRPKELAYAECSGCTFSWSSHTRARRWQESR
jgi:carbon storage regulator